MQTPQQTAAAEPAPTSKPIKVKTEGQRLFMQLPGSLEQLRRRTRAKSRQTVLYWRTGERKPPPAVRRELERAFGIPAATWSLKPTSTDPAAPAPPVPANDNAVPVVPVVPASDPPVFANVPAPARGNSSSLEECLQLLANIRAARSVPGLLPSEQVKLADAEARILGLRAKLELSAETSEARYVAAHPAWIKLKRAILKALEKHPIALAAVEAAIEEVLSA